MRLDAVVFLVVDGADVEVVLELLEGLFDFGEHNVLLPEFLWVFGDEIRAQQVGAFASAGFAQLLPVEAGAQVPHGLEMGPFSYYPEMASEDAERLNLLNKEMMLELLLKAEAPVAAFSGYGLTVESPRIKKISSIHWNALRAALEKGYL